MQSEAIRRRKARSATFCRFFLIIHFSSRKFLNFTRTHRSKHETSQVPMLLRKALWPPPAATNHQIYLRADPGHQLLTHQSILMDLMTIEIQILIMTEQLHMVLGATTLSKSICPRQLHVSNTAKCSEQLMWTQTLMQLQLLIEEHRIHIHRHRLPPNLLTTAMLLRATVLIFMKIKIRASKRTKNKQQAQHSKSPLTVCWWRGIRAATRLVGTKRYSSRARRALTHSHIRSHSHSHNIGISHHYSNSIRVRVRVRTTGTNHMSLKVRANRTLEAASHIRLKAVTHSDEGWLGGIG